MKNFYYIYNFLLLFIIYFSAEITFKHKKKSVFFLKLSSPLILLVIICLFISDIFSLIDTHQISHFLSLILNQFIMIILFMFCICAGFIESIKHKLPTIPFIKYRNHVNLYLSRKGLPQFSVSRFFMVFALMVLGTMLILHIFNPQISEEAKQRILKTGWGKLGVIFLVLPSAVIEEIVFRFFLQTKLASYLKNMSIAIIISSVAWAAGHYGMLQPEGIKELQIFYIGIILGFVRNKWGIETAIMLHLLMNLTFSFMLLFN